MLSVFLQVQFFIYTKRVTLISDQEERERGVKAFRERKKDVLVATDVASKGLDFQGIKHVINYDMPDDIENYGEPIFTVFSLLTRHIIFIHECYLKIFLYGSVF